MSTFVPDPNLVVGALRWIEHQYCEDPAVTTRAAEALPHAEAIAEMWDWTMPQAAAVQELIAAARETDSLLATNTKPIETHARLRAALKAVSA